MYPKCIPAYHKCIPMFPNLKKLKKNRIKCIRIQYVLGTHLWPTENPCFIGITYTSCAPFDAVQSATENLFGLHLTITFGYLPSFFLPFVVIFLLYLDLDNSLLIGYCHWRTILCFLYLWQSRLALKPDGLFLAAILGGETLKLVCIQVGYFHTSNLIWIIIQCMGCLTVFLFPPLGSWE